jgi:hypothetical protein
VVFRVIQNRFERLIGETIETSGKLNSLERLELIPPDLTPINDSKGWREDVMLEDHGRRRAI